MANLTILPTWAVRHISEHLAGHLHVVNALPVHESFGRQTYLVNTSQGAVFLEKKRGSDPRHWLLPLPAPHHSFSCDKCGERIEFVDPALPRPVFCTQCGTQYKLQQKGDDIVLVKTRAR